MPDSLTLYPELQTAEKLGVSPRTLQRWRVEGRGPAYRKLGTRIAYAERDLQEYIESCRRQSTSQKNAA
jgi:predicted site-specific integrase-resolvase